MKLLDCPNCGRRLKAPEAALAKRLRCPVCREVFGNGFDEKIPDDTPVPGKAPGVNPRNDEPYELGSHSGGSGLLELTRESDDTTLGNLFYGDPELPPPAPGQPDDITEKSLTMANRLADDHATDARRARRTARVAGTLAVLLLAASIVIGFLAMNLLRRSELAEQEAAMLRGGRATTDADYEQQQRITVGLYNELLAAREAALRAEARVEAIQARLAKAEQKLEQLASTQPGE